MARLSILLLLGWLFVPFYIKSGVYTMPEFLEKRYNSASRVLHLGLGGRLRPHQDQRDAVCGRRRDSRGHGVGFLHGSDRLIVITGLYTIFGGLRAVVYTEVLQAIVLFSVGAALMVIGLSQVGGLAGLEAVPAGFFSMWKPSNHPDFPWTGVIFGAPILGIWYWCTDQHIVQRVLAAKNIKEARTGTIFAGDLKISPFSSSCSGASSRWRCFRTSATTLIRVSHAGDAAPAGRDQGLMVAAMLAALMWSLAAAFNAARRSSRWTSTRRWAPRARAAVGPRGPLPPVVMVFLGISGFR